MSRVHTELIYQWDGTEYRLTQEQGYDYDGPVALCCGATGEQKSSFADEQSFSKLMTENYKTEFADSENIFNTLTSTFSPIVAAGPNQQGFSAGELAARNSYASDSTAQQYGNAAKAVGEKMAAAGGGNTYIPSGASTQVQEEVANAGARQLSGEQNQIQQENYATGRQNWLEASKVLGAAPQVFDSTSKAAGEVNTGQKNASDTANQIAQASNSWMGAVGGVLGAAASAGMGGL